jgi:hypothetical protein
MHEHLDLASIMHYPSNSGYAKKSCIDDGEDCPLYAYVDSNDHSKGKYMIEQSRKPSLDDILWVKRNYPWKVST